LRRLCPTSVSIAFGEHLQGSLTSFYYADGGDNNPNNENSTLELKIYFNGGGLAQLTVNLL